MKSNGLISSLLRKHLNADVMEQEQVKLIDSCYPAQKAREVIISLLNEKIKFLNHQIFSNQERSGNVTSHLEQRVKELKAEKERLQQSLEKLEQTNHMVEINCDINIRVLAEEPSS